MVEKNRVPYVYTEFGEGVTVQLNNKCPCDLFNVYMVSICQSDNTF
jgi:hypothetical protein